MAGIRIKVECHRFGSRENVVWGTGDHGASEITTVNTAHSGSEEPTEAHNLVSVSL